MYSKSLFMVVAISSSFPIYGETFWPLTTKCESALALSASPQNIRENAGVYVLGESGYELVRKSANNYMCLVERATDNSLLPQCFDKLGQQVHIPIHMDAAKQRLAGESWQSIRQQRAEKFANGTYQSVKGHGVVYMASDFNLFVSQDGKTKLRIAPHVMFHAPNVTMEDMNASEQSTTMNWGMPIIASPGPMGFMVSFVEHATDSNEVKSACAGQLPDTSEFVRTPARLR